MNEKQTKFCYYISVGYSAEKAAKQAGYSDPRTAQKLLKNNNITQELARLEQEKAAEQAEKDKEKLPTRENLLKKLAEIALTDPKFPDQRPNQLKALRELRLMLKQDKD